MTMATLEAAPVATDEAASPRPEEGSVSDTAIALTGQRAVEFTEPEDIVAPCRLPRFVRPLAIAGVGASIVILTGGCGAGSSDEDLSADKTISCDADPVHIAKDGTQRKITLKARGEDVSIGTFKTRKDKDGDLKVQRYNGEKKAFQDFDKLTKHLNGKETDLRIKISAGTWQGPRVSVLCADVAQDTKWD